VSRYRVYIAPQALQEIKDLPGHIRQRIKRAIDSLKDDPHPSESEELEVPSDIEASVFRLRLDKWRVVYTIAVAENTVDVLAVRKRPPYDYGDLEQLLSDIE
jgi:mRNA interferase RelE/StbE